MRGKKIPSIFCISFNSFLVTTPCVKMPSMDNPSFIPSRAVTITEEPTADVNSLRPGSGAPLTVDQDTATITVKVVPDAATEGVEVGKVDIPNDDNNVKGFKVGYKLPGDDTIIYVNNGEVR